CDVQESIVIGVRVMGLDDSIDQRITLFGQRQIINKINSVDFTRGSFVRSPYPDLAVNPAGTENRGIDQISAIGTQDDAHVLQRFKTVHFAAKHRNESR